VLIISQCCTAQASLASQKRKDSIGSVIGNARENMTLAMVLGVTLSG
jgi:hypothetical protein